MLQNRGVMLQYLWSRVGIKGKPPRNLPHTSLLYVMLKMGPPCMFLCPQGDQVLSLYALASDDVFKSIDGHLARIILLFLKKIRPRIHTLQN